MPKVTANNVTINYDQQGTGEPLILIPYLAADHACYAFQVAEYRETLYLHLARPPRHRRIGRSWRRLLHGNARG